MVFDKFYEMVISDNETVIEEKFVDKLKLAVLATVFGIQAASIPYINREVKNILDNSSEQNIQRYKRKMNQLLRQPSADVMNKVREFSEILDKTPSGSRNITDSADDNSDVTGMPNRETSEESFLINASQYISANEGYKTRLYDVTRGRGIPDLTIGIGHHVIPSDIKTGVLKKGEYTLDKNGNIVDATLTNARVMELFKNDFNAKLRLIRLRFPTYSAFPEPLKIAILDGYYRGDISGSPKTKNLIAAAIDKAEKNDFQAARVSADLAATEYLKNQEFLTASESGISGIVSRMNRNAELIRHAFDRNYTFSY